MKRRISIKALLLLAVPLIFSGVTLGRFVADKIRSGREEPLRIAQVKTALPVAGNLAENIEYSGTVIPENTVLLHSRVAGRILTLPVSEGDRVEEGTILVSLDKEILQLQADQAKASWEAAQAAYEKVLKGARAEEIENAESQTEQFKNDLNTAERNLERIERLYQSGSVAKTRLEEAENGYSGAKTRYENALRSLELLKEGAAREDLSAAKANAEAARKNYDLALLQLRESDVTAPIDGTVTKIYIEEGNFVDQSVPLLSIVQDDSLYVSLSLPEKRYTSFRNNPEEITVSISAPSFNGITAFSGRISSVSPIINPASRTFDVEITVPNRDHLLRPGMFVVVSFSFPSREKGFLLPESSLVFRDNQPVVFIYSKEPPGTAAMKPVTAGDRRNGLVEILNGLEQDQPVIIEGNVFLEDGQRVEPVNPL